MSKGQNSHSQKCHGYISNGKAVKSERTAEITKSEMSTPERALQALMFELLGLVMVVPLAAWLTGESGGHMTVVGALLCIFALLWNYVYNLWFDSAVAVPRAKRGFWLRVGHVLGFELGLVLVSVPVIAWYLEVSLWQALLLDAGFLLFFFVYGGLFFWLYDKLRPLWHRPAPCNP